VIGLLFVFTIPVSAAPQESWGILGTHVVRWGETLFCIGRAYGVDPWAIASQNGIYYTNYIYPGTILQIPNAPATLPAGPTCTRQFTVPGPGPWPVGCTCRYYHTITTGQTLSGISLYYGVNMWSIAECNNIYNLNYIRTADTLCIP